MFSLAKFFGGFAIWQGEKLGKLLYILIIIAVCLGIFWGAFIKRTEVHNQQADVIQNIEATHAPRAFVGIKFWWIRAGISVEKID